MQGAFARRAWGGMEGVFLTEAPASSWGFGRQVKILKKISMDCFCQDGVIYGVEILPYIHFQIIFVLPTKSLRPFRGGIGVYPTDRRHVSRHAFLQLAVAGRNKGQNTFFVRSFPPPLPEFFEKGGFTVDDFFCSDELVQLIGVEGSAGGSQGMVIISNGMADSIHDEKDPAPVLRKKFPTKPEAGKISLSRQRRERETALDMRLYCAPIREQGHTEGRACTPNGAEAQIVVAIAGRIVVTIGRPQVPTVVVPAAAAFHPVRPACKPFPFFVSKI